MQKAAHCLTEILLALVMSSHVFSSEIKLNAATWNHLPPNSINMQLTQLTLYQKFRITVEFEVRCMSLDCDTVAHYSKLVKNAIKRHLPVGSIAADFVKSQF